jgi:hypothetical protein
MILINILIILLQLLPIEYIKAAADKPLPFFNQELYKATTEENVFTFWGSDSLIQHKVKLLVNKDERPVFYAAEIITPVCYDTLCKPVHIKIYWNLVGEFAGYGTLAGFPLTKFDHLEYSSADYEKLNQLLQDDISILSRQKVNDLVDAGKERHSKTVDAVTAATQLAVKSVIVDGALYSCFTIWHLVHGEVKGKIRKQSAALYDDELHKEFLFSDSNSYWLYALQRMADSDFERFMGQIFFIFKSANPLVRKIILQNMPARLLEANYIQVKFSSHFSFIDQNSRTLLLKRLEQAKKIDQKCLQDLCVNLELMSRNQIKYLFRILKREKNLPAGIYTTLKQAATADDFEFAHIVKRELEQLQSK